MSIEKLSEFAKTGDKNTDDLDLERGFPSRLQPARQWFNYLFNALSVKINEIITNSDDLAKDKISYTDIVDDLVTPDAEKPLSAKMGKKLADEKLDKSDLASGSAPIFAVRAWANFNGGDAAVRSHGNIAKITRLGVGTYSVEFKVDMPSENYSVTTAQSGRGDATSLAVSDPTIRGFTLRANYGGDNTQGGYDPIACFFQVVC